MKKTNPIIICSVLVLVFLFNRNILAQNKTNPYDYPDTLWVYGTAKKNDYGLTPKKAIKVGGGLYPKHVYRYLNSLVDANGIKISYKRIGSCCSDKIHRDEPLTSFEIQANGKTITLYFDQYSWEEPMIIQGFGWKELRKGYVGEFKNDSIFQGKGIYFFGDGGYYKGEWADGLMNGTGTMFIPDQETYKGNFLNGKYEGFGILEYPDGGSYEGNWKAGLKSGKGKIFYPPGSEIKYMEGEFVDDKPKGSFKVFNTNGTTETHSF